MNTGIVVYSGKVDICQDKKRAEDRRLRQKGLDCVYLGDLGPEKSVLRK